MPPGRRSLSVKRKQKKSDAIVLIPTTRSQRKEIPEMLLIIMCSSPDTVRRGLCHGEIRDWKVENPEGKAYLPYLRLTPFAYADSAAMKTVGKL